MSRCGDPAIKVPAFTLWLRTRRHAHSVGVQAAGQIVEAVRWQSRLAFYHSDDAFAWYSYDRYAL